MERIRNREDKVHESSRVHRKNSHSEKNERSSSKSSGQKKSSRKRHKKLVKEKKKSKLKKSESRSVSSSESGSSDEALSKKRKSRTVSELAHEGSLPATISKSSRMKTESDRQKEIVRKNADIALSRMIGGDIDRANKEQEQMQNLYGASDWRVKQKLSKENRKLKHIISAGKRLDAAEAREAEKMDAFRVAMGLPTAEQERQAKWREEASRSTPVYSDQAAQALHERRLKSARIGPSLPK